MTTPAPNDEAAAVEPARRDLPRVLLRAAAALLVALNAAAFFGAYPYFELATHFRLQYALAATPLALALAAVRSWRFAVLAAACALLNWTYVAPYISDRVLFSGPAASAASVPSPGDARARLMVANLQFDNDDREAVLASVRSAAPDVIVFVELTADWWERVEPLRQDFPYYQVVAKSGADGLGILSKHPIQSAEVLQFTSVWHPALKATILVDGSPLVVLGMHPQKPNRSGNFANRNSQLARAAAVMRETPGPKVLVGDLNVTPWSPYFESLVRDSGLEDARIGRGLLPTFPVPLPAFLRIPIDHCLAGGGVAVERIVARGDTGSDHCALVVDLRIAADARVTDERSASYVPPR